MQIKVRVKHLRELAKREHVGSVIEGLIRYESDEHKVGVPFDALSTREMDVLIEIAKKGGDIDLQRKLTSFLKLQDNAAGVPIGKLPLLAQAIKNIMQPLPHKWLFRDMGDGHLVPFFVKEVTYSERCRDAPARCCVKLAHIEQGRLHHPTPLFSQEALEQKPTAVALLNQKGYFLEKPPLVAAYEADIAQYKEWCVQTGRQFLARGFGNAEVSSWRTSRTAMEREGRPVKVIMDDLEQREGHADSSCVDSSFWNAEKPGRSAEEEEDTSVVVAPIHPVVTVFDLEKHWFVDLHIANLEPYQYNTALAEKLVLPKDKKDLVDMLVQGAGMLMEDIVQGKTGGVIILATGLPGTGKTLTAEVYSEVVAQPLYVVQCSQLGTSEDELEKRLTEVLSRAARWKAVLLIDEADVYIHERGKDVAQNAIVGVFLRVLEYYRGVLFLTSNRATIIDDAILSRATAHLRYEQPTRAELAQIWEVLARQFQIKLPGTVVSALVERFPTATGRNVKNLLKLSNMLATRRGCTVSKDLVIHAAQFLDIEQVGEQS